MYAAANGSLDVISTLIKAGAEVRLRDSKGFLAVDYMQGKGPVPKNSVLSRDDFEKARRLLTP